MSRVMRKSVFGISEHQEMSKIHVKSFFPFLKTLVVIDVTPYVALQPGF